MHGYKYQQVVDYSHCSVMDVLRRLQLPSQTDDGGIVILKSSGYNGETLVVLADSPTPPHTLRTQAGIGAPTLPKTRVKYLSTRSAHLDQTRADLERQLREFVLIPGEAVPA